MNRQVSLINKLKSGRTRYDIRTKDIADYLGVHPSVVSYIEKTAEKNSRFRYLQYLRSKGVDLNELFG